MPAFVTSILTSLRARLRVQSITTDSPARSARLHTSGRRASASNTALAGLLDAHDSLGGGASHHALAALVLSRPAQNGGCRRD